MYGVRAVIMHAEAQRDWKAGLGCTKRSNLLICVGLGPVVYGDEYGIGCRVTLHFEIYIALDSDGKYSVTKLDLSKLERIAKHLPPGEDLTLITLKGHLLVEELLEELIASHCKNPAALNGDIGFAVKLKFARALTGAEELSIAWTACQKLNSLRNALAHKLEHPEAQKRLASFLATFDDPSTEWQRTGSESTDLRRALLFLLGALQGIGKPVLLKGLGIAV